MFMTHIDVAVLQNYFSFPIVGNDFARASNKSSICQFSWLTFLKPHNCLIVTKSVNLHEDTVWIVDSDNELYFMEYFLHNGLSQKTFYLLNCLNCNVEFWRHNHDDYEDR